MQDFASAGPGNDLAALIDHTILKPEASRADVARHCDEAVANGFASVCVNGVHVAFVAERLRGTPVKTCAVLGFPLGAGGAGAKAAEAAWLVGEGADELDMVLDIGALREGDLDRVCADIAAVREAFKGRVLKVILETCLLNEAQITAACRIAAEAGADFVKTSTGFSTGGASVEVVELMRRTVGPDVGVKASGGIRTAETARAMVAAGANRIGASASVAIVGAAKESASGGY
ncbi:deoxyribose-phosphate aldolase [Aureimonas phyllosphaerae]|uniref:Deoxyribose-phosphate aldolase n=1 Tax=Aureimonas phyllosphaerae TaxID=1166078 RepID=A0A7W6BQ27_9HYPH|nr:deoxyribose-phosphate aldolase [Aureimonas phyllosphaerae]MBB3934190.1 deoxyribose-phosphate aldolase [Aureimonas phyllosphaerae]MBB3958594.1 deoxyribose-phosphate aldolase [Aureimonas phyllosphaerae]SFE99377.1 deoxyribose-phosphate aldolase [Aureimonas phyllosphaerae]